MCYSGCHYENYHGECTARRTDLRPCEYEDSESYEQAMIDAADLRAEMLWEQQRDNELLGLS